MFVLGLATFALLASRVSAQAPDVNQATIDLIKTSESFQAEPLSKDGTSTIGFGHICDDGECGDVTYPQPLSEGDGEALLRQDIKPAQDAVASAIAEGVTLNANQYGALVDFAFDYGAEGLTEGLADSALIGRINAGEEPSAVASEELPATNDDGDANAENRRGAEVDLFNTPTEEGALSL